MITRALPFESGPVKKSKRKPSSASRPAYVSRWWRPEVSNSSEHCARAAKEAAKDLYLPPHQWRALELATRSEVTTAESYGNNAISELQCASRSPHSYRWNVLCAFRRNLLGVPLRGRRHKNDVRARCRRGHVLGPQLDRSQKFATRMRAVHRQRKQDTEPCCSRWQSTLITGRRFAHYGV